MICEADTFALITILSGVRLRWTSFADSWRNCSPFATCESPF